MKAEVKRNVSAEEYERERKNNPNALDYPKVREQGVIAEIKNSNWIVVNNKFPYVEYETRKVEKCFLLIPKSNKIKLFKDIPIEDFKEIQKYIDILRKKTNEKFIFQVMFKESGKSIDKFHIHIIISYRNL